MRGPVKQSLAVAGPQALPTSKMLRSIELLGPLVAPIVDKELTAEVVRLSATKVAGFVSKQSVSTQSLFFESPADPNLRETYGQADFV